MIRTYCDCCGTEMIGPNDPQILKSIRIKGVKNSYRTSLLVGEVRINENRSYTDTDPEHVCFGCIADAVAAADKRPKEPLSGKLASMVFSLEEIDSMASANGYDLVMKKVADPSS